VRPDVLFGHYLYATSASAPMVTHFAELAGDIVPRYAGPGELVVEVGSNDGVLLRPLRTRGAAVLGIEPAANLAAAANAEGLETRNDFFGSDVARRIVTDRGRAKAVIANNVLAHIDDLHDVATALDALLADDGVFVAEFPYLADLIEKVEYDTIYHEHLSYLSLAPLDVLFSTVGLELFDARRIALHGGSLRIYAGRAGRNRPTDALRALREVEARSGLADEATYARLADRVRASRDALRSAVREVRAAGRTLGALGATAKSCTLLHYCGLGSDDIAFIADSTSQKQGRLAPGTHIPIRPERALVDEMPERALLLAWNYADAVVKRHAEYVMRGGRFIHPIPLAHLIP